ncbi:MAG: isoleucine--tRNA ligase [Gammaproteobacteria bacterium]|nr:isoleucine--tRNA ligase [Gammaproteobacteria bacterium]
MHKRFEEPKSLDLPALEREVLEFWEREDIFRRCVDARAGRPEFTFYEGPPTANGRPGIHHVLSRTIKDAFCRYKTLKGFHVERKAGWDTHGLPVEIEVEKELGLDSRESVEAYGIARYNAACRASVQRYTADWNELTRRIGYWVDLDDPYVTCHTSYIETVWWLLKRMHDRGLLYRGYKITWYSPGTGTVLSSHEVSLGYREVDDPSVYVRFRALDEHGASFLAWTTTPWTLVSNAALAVGPDIEYVKVRHVADGGTAEVLYLARARLAVLKGEVEELASMPGRALVGRRYEPLFRLDPGDLDTRDAWRVVAADYVTTEDGTGIVHTAPAFGAEDYDTGQREGLPLFNPIHPDGHFAAATPVVGGQWFKDADRLVCRDLRARDLLYRQETCRHNYPHDWRKGTPLMSYPVESWFVRTTALRDRLVELNRSIRWYPPAIRDGRFGNWLENNVDWALSRRRYWGTPLPIWRSDAPDSEYFEVIGSIAELRARCGDGLDDDASIDLHRPYVDGLTWPAPDGGTMRRVTDVIDVWFDSGAMPFAQWHYPFENEDVWQRHFPADFICEGLDQTRGWFYTLHAIATLTMDSVAFRNVVVNGLILDEKGEKMSKSRGNTVDPFATVDAHGADVLRWYMLANSPPWENMKYSDRGLRETRSKFFDTLFNVYRFFAAYANIDGFTNTAARIPVVERTELDRWMLSRLNTTVTEADAAYDGYDATRAARAVERLVDELSNWYIRRSRPRFWTGKKSGAGVTVSDHDKLCAYQTTLECLVAIAGLMSPVAPFFADWLHRALAGAGLAQAAPSVHMTDFPAADALAIDLELERRMQLARTIVTEVLLLRNQSKIKVRQPLARIMVVTGGHLDRDTIERVREPILEELNVQAIEYIADSSEIVSRSAKPSFPALGPRLGKLMGPAGKVIRALDGAAISRYLADGALTIEVNGQAVELGAGDLEISSEAVGEWLVASRDGVTVALDTHLTDTLIDQGYARETVNRIQNMRKALDLALTDRIHVQYAATPRLAAAIAAHTTLIRRETLALALDTGAVPAGDMVQTFDVEGESLTIGLRRGVVA